MSEVTTDSETGHPSISSIDDVVAAVAANLSDGLTAQDASSRLTANGANKLRAAPPVAGWRRVLAHFQDPLVYLLLAAIAIALGAWIIEGRVGWPVDAIVITVVVLINAAIGYVQESKATQAVAALAKMTEVTSSVLRDGQVRRVPSVDLVLGDILVLAEGDAVGADARLIEATALRVQEASLTGESEAVLKDAATLASQQRSQISSIWCSRAPPLRKARAAPS